MGWISSFVPKLFKKTIPRSLAAVRGGDRIHITGDFFLSPICVYATIALHCYPPMVDGMLYWICATLLATLYTFSIDEKNEYDFFRTLVEHTIFRILHRMDCTIHNK